jgi:nucleotide-binding universal stress UspA family protein
MYRSILVGIDGSPTAKEALNRAARLAESEGAELHIVCAYHGQTLVAIDPISAAGANMGDLEASMRQAAEQLLEVEVKNLGRDGLKVHTHAVEGEPSDALIDAAEAHDCDLIVVGNRGMRGGKRLLLGSVPNRVAHHAGRDVLIVHTA